MLTAEGGDVAAEARARQILDDLQDAVATKDATRVAELLADDLVLFGTAAESLDGVQARAYLDRVLQQDGTIRWGWDQVVPVVDEPALSVFAVVGTVGFEDAQGATVGQRDRFRLTCVAVLEGGRWRLSHFHGSVPQDDDA